MKILTLLEPCEVCKGAPGAAESLRRVKVAKQFDFVERRMAKCPPTSSVR